MRALTDPVNIGAVTIALPQDVQAEAWDWPVELFDARSGTSPGPGLSRECSGRRLPRFAPARVR